MVQIQTILVYEIKMKIGIITYHRALNYGAALQAFALSVKLKNLGHEAEVIDYRCNYIEGDYYKVLPKNIKSLKAIVKRIANFPQKKKLASTFRAFESENKYLSSKVYKLDTIKETNSIYDLFISGSDQIWNNYGSNSDYTYLLDFVDDYTKKVAYSASFGYQEIPKQVRADYIRLLSQYNGISVRETSGARIVSNLINKIVPVTCDPVLLLDELQWKELIDTSLNPHGDYILCYFLRYNVTGFAEALKFATAKGIKVIAIDNMYMQKKFHGIEMKSNVSLKEFVSLFANAAGVMTDSFHGTVFSLTFNKPFNTLLSRNVNVNSRIVDLLNMLELSSHMIYDFKESDWRRIDYKNVNQKIAIYRERSLEYLKKFIK